LDPKQCYPISPEMWGELHRLKRTTYVVQILSDLFPLTSTTGAFESLLCRIQPVVVIMAIVVAVRKGDGI
jgi:hypothetical protein